MRITENLLRDMIKQANTLKMQNNIRTNEKLILRGQNGYYQVNTKIDNMSGENAISGYGLTARETYYYLKGYMDNIA